MSSRRSRPEALAPDTVVVGRILRPHGVRGEAVVEVLTDRPDRFEAGGVLTVEQLGRPRSLTIDSSRSHKGRLLVRFEGVDDRDRAEDLRGGVLTVARDLVEPAPEGSYYFFELIGCEVVDAAAGSLGVVEDVVEDGGGLLLEVRFERAEPASEGRLLVPFVEAYLDRVDVAERRIEVTLPPGLLETCESTS